jgi:hypothetical protein
MAHETARGQLHNGGFQDGAGERLEKARRRSLLLPTLAIGVLSGAIGFVIGQGYPDTFFDPAAKLPSPVALLAVFGYVAAAVIGVVLIRKKLDEVQRQNQLRQAAVAAGAYYVGYPIWFLLWKGGFAPEPMHWLIFIAVVAAAALAAAYQAMAGRS